MIFRHELADRLRMVVANQIGRRFHIHQSPTKTVVRPGVATIVGGMNQQALECAGPHRTTGKQRAVLLDEQSRGSASVWRRHASTAVSAIGGVAAVE